MTDLETRRAENRATMPATTAIFDHVTEVFGPGCRLLYAAENGRVVGNVKYAHRRGGVDAIPGEPPTPQHESFRSLLVEEYIKLHHRLPVSADELWLAFYRDAKAKRFDAFIP